MWLADCELDLYEWRRTIVVLSSASAPFILAAYLIYKNQMKRWISYTLLSSFLIAVFGWEIWVNFGFIEGDPVNLRRSVALSCAQMTRFLVGLDSWLLIDKFDVSKRG